MLRLARALPALLLVSFTSFGAHAQAPQAKPGAASASADALFAEGSALLKAGSVDEACVKLQQSHTLEPAIGTLGLLAYCHEQSGKLATAIREYGEVAELAHLAGQAEREQVARQRAGELLGRVSRLSVVISEPPADVEVFLDARRLGASELGASTPVDAGTFVLRIQGKAVEPWVKTVSIPADGSTLRVVVPRLAAKAATSAPAPATPPRATRPERSGARRAAVWTSFGVGAAGVAVGSYFGLSAVSAKSDSSPHCRGNDCDQAGVDARARALDHARVSTVAFTVGLVGAAAGVVLLLTDRSAEPTQQAALNVVPGGAALRWERRF